MLYTYIFNEIMVQNPSADANRRAHLVKKFRTFMELEVSLPCHKIPPLEPIKSPLNVVHSITTYFFWSVLILSSHLLLGPLSGCFPTAFPTKALYAPIISSTRTKLLFVLFISYERNTISTSYTYWTRSLDLTISRNVSYNLFVTAYIRQSWTQKLASSHYRARGRKPETGQKSNPIRMRQQPRWVNPDTLENETIVLYVINSPTAHVLEVISGFHWASGFPTAMDLYPMDVTTISTS
jgi:hypothetical protein